MVIKLNPYHYETFARWLDRPFIDKKFIDYMADNTTEEFDYFLELNDWAVKYLKDFCPYPFITDKL